MAALVLKEILAGAMKGGADRVKMFLDLPKPAPTRAATPPSSEALQRAWHQHQLDYERRMALQQMDMVQRQQQQVARQQQARVYPTIARWYNDGMDLDYRGYYESTGTIVSSTTT